MTVEVGFIFMGRQWSIKSIHRKYSFPAIFITCYTNLPVLLIEKKISDNKFTFSLKMFIDYEGILLFTIQ